LPMQAFGVDADVDALCRRRRVQEPSTEAPRSEHVRRAAKHSDIEDITRRRHFEAKGTTISGDGSPPPRQRTRLPHSRSGEVLPVDSRTYDMPSDGRCSRRYLDETSRAKYYAEIIGRAASSSDRSLGHTSSAVKETGLPLGIRRVLAATLPNNLPTDVAERIKADVEAQVHCRFGARKTAVVPLRSKEQRRTPNYRAEQHNLMQQFAEQRHLIAGESCEGHPKFLETSPGRLASLHEVPDESPAPLTYEELVSQLLARKAKEQATNKSREEHRVSLHESALAAEAAEEVARHEEVAEGLPTLLTSRSRRTSQPLDQSRRHSWPWSEDSDKLGAEFFEDPSPSL
jgi:hypothetical protein